VQSIASVHRKFLLILGMSFVFSGALLPAMSMMGEIDDFASDNLANAKRLLVRDATLLQGADTPTQMAGIIPADRMTTWNPGLNPVGGIPNRTTVYRTLSPRGGSLDDTAAIQTALDFCPRGQVVKLSPGTFNINGGGLRLRRSDCTLRGSGTGAPGSGNGGTRLIKADRDTNRSFAILYVGNNAGEFSSSINLAADAAKGTNSLILVSSPRIAVGEIVLIDQITDNDPRVWWGPQHNPPGGGSRRWFARQDRSLTQMMEVTAVNRNTITFSTPFHTTFKTECYSACNFDPLSRGIGVQN
jgi:hypothetical protein